ncbi:bifunctional 3-(3-hydroxy-phenyl)propionate/3-hydroxycinnamic acid hydroxylase [Skermania piniformis]|uniref:Bifunctional 3-(3-hydroxy-phenyl)propionate/3-hydroxycinnamic acid hydroxylase n=1 Tax=Skermania pinensis TaxID=39122 RepID=A0ABX8SAW1_9ACTN|nr:bifunctional 3-(3-hydroxy-phenyl)propionate/3-hydroxycinnamic acid hydroxylase [Skermania piniformis]QXQ13590.1 bifunctional 3-(3-hydroxy-phenyl)propionate/3-hydroxycinnamic acid hydroxylase [Skermania piniformis]
MTDQPYDVAIVGYGPTGVTAANLLGQAGLKVVVIEREPSIYARARAISTDEEVVRIWQQVGLADRLKEDMLTERPIDFVDAHNKTMVSFAAPVRGHGHPPQMFIYQPALEQVLRDGVDRFPNVEVMLEREVVKVRQDAAGVELMVADNTSDTFVRVHAKYVIAADGGSSGIRGLLGVGYAGKTYEDKWVVIDTKVLKSWPDVDRLRFHCNPLRPAVDCPTPLDHHRWEFPVLPGEDASKLTTDDNVWKLLDWQGVTRDHVDVLRAVVYSHHVRFADRWRVGRIFLAGDAAHAMPPWIGQGMAAGVRDAANLCWKLAAVVKGELPDSVLDSYQTERMPHVRDITDKAVFVGKIITERNPTLTTLRNPALRILNVLPVVGKRFKDGNWVPEAHYPDGFFDTDKAGATGWKTIQPWVLDSEGTRRRLDDVLGSQWTVLYRTRTGGIDAWTKAGAQLVQLVPGGSNPESDRIVDIDNTLIKWMKTKGATAIAIRPDGFVYSAAGDGSPLPPPPAGLRASALSPA